jgi:hypothetical protein
MLILQGAHEFIECFINEEIRANDAQTHLLVKDTH